MSQSRARADASHPLLDALEPVAIALGASLIRPGEVGADDIPLRWEGEVVGGWRGPDGAAADAGLHGALGRLIEQVEDELGGHLAELSREDKQRAVRLLDDRGAFLLRRAVEDVADALGVSRITVYNYLNAIRP
ncbi:MAG TPA: helix-turn-helix domain-containing protein [Acidimicrobiales bacterium]